MEITTKQLKLKTGKIISHVSNGQEITVTYRGKPRAKIIPINTVKISVPKEPENELFGIWRDKIDTDNVEQFVRKIRKGRKLGTRLNA